MRVTIPANGWRPRPYQMPAWTAFEAGKRRLVLCWHRRAGKDEIALNVAAVAAHLRPANYWHCLPEYNQARKAIWEAVDPRSGKKRIDLAFPKVLRKSTREDMMSIEFKSGATWRVVGSDNPDSLVGASPAGIVFSEWALSNPSAWGYLAPILDENDGWAIFISTPRGRNHFQEMVEVESKRPGWFGEVLTVRDTGYSLERVETQRIEYHGIFGRDQGDALIEQEYFCSFEAAILGSYYGKEMAELARLGQIGSVPCWPGVPVHTAWDLGSSRGGDTMTIWFWQVAPSEKGQGQIRVISCLSGSAMSISHYANEIRMRRLAWATETRTDYQVIKGMDYVPHDARVPEMTSSGHDGRAKQRIEVMIECGLKPKIVTEHYVSDGVSAVRQVLPRTWFDASACTVGIEALRQYQREWDDEKKVFKDTPLKNWATHWADAFRYLAMAFREVVVVPEVPKGKLLSIGPQNQVTMDDLWAMNKRTRKRI